MMRPAPHILVLLLLALPALPACGKKAKDDDADGKRAAEQAPRKPHTWRLTTPPGHPLHAALVFELLRKFDDLVGYVALDLPGPLAPADSEIAWTKDTEGEAAHCVGETVPALVPGRPLGMRLRVNLAYVESFAPNRGDLINTPLFRAFVHCVGHGLGMEHADDPLDLMHGDPSAATQFDAFFARVRVLAGVP